MIAAVALSSLGVLGGIAAPAQAADMCNAVALIEIPNTTTGFGLKKGETDEAVTVYNVDKYGQGQFCSHGGGCYPRFLIKDGRKVEALRLTNCKIGAAEPPFAGLPDDGTVSYNVTVVRSKNSASDLRYDDIDNALLNIGMCSACASNAAELYIRSPASKCGSNVADALAGDKVAIEALEKNPDYCLDSNPISPATTASAAPTVAPNPSPIAALAAPVQQTPPAVSSSPKTLIKVAITIAAILYFVPALISFTRRKRNAKAILALNLFLGWSFLGWVAALIWSLLNDASGERR